MVKKETLEAQQSATYQLFNDDIDDTRRWYYPTSLSSIS